MKKEELRKLIIATDRKNQKNKRNRLIKAYLLFAVLLACFFYMFDSDLIDSIIAGLVISPVYILLNLVIFGQISDAARNEDAYLQSLIKKYETEHKESIIL